MSRARRTHSRPARKRAPAYRRDPKITLHNKKVNYAVKAGAIELSRKALLYPMDSSGPRMLLLPSRESYDPACGSSAWSEDLDTDEWFRGAQTMTSIRSFPGTNCRLKNGYDIIVLARRERRSKPAQVNHTVQKLFALRWIGNIVVVKRGFRERGCALNITPPEISLINSLIERWIQLEL